MKSQRFQTISTSLLAVLLICFFGACANLTPSSETSGAAGTSSSGSTPSEQTSSVFSKPRTLVIPEKKQIGQGGCKGTQGPVWTVDDGVIVEVSIDNARSCGFKSLKLRIGYKYYELSVANDAFKLNKRGILQFEQRSGQLYFRTGSQLPQVSFQNTFGLWEYTCDGSTCLSDPSVLATASTEQKALQDQRQAIQKAQSAKQQANDLEALRRNAEQCLNAKVPNPYPVPNETTRLYGDCAGGTGTNGIVMWLQRGVPYDLSCLKNGEYVKVNDISGDNICTKYFPLLPQYCKTDTYHGQCRNGIPDGLGIDSTDNKRIPTTYTASMGQFKNGKLDGYGAVTVAKRCGIMGCVGGIESTIGIYQNGSLKLACTGGPDGCAKATAAVAVYEKARQASNAGRCDEARALDRKAQGMDAQKHSSSDYQNGSSIDFRSCSTEAAFAKAKNSRDPQAIYVAASRYESNGERERARTLYRQIVNNFRSHPVAQKAADRLTRLADVEAVESSNREVQRSLQEAQEAAYRQCIAKFGACIEGCDAIKDATYRTRCKGSCGYCSK